MARRRTTRRRAPGRRYMAKRKPNIKTVTPMGALSNLTVGQMASTALKGVNLLKSIINSELKRFDVNSNSQISDNGSVILLNNMAAGTDASERTGNTILAKYLTLSLMAEGDPTVDYTNLRALIVVDTMNQTSFPTLSSVLQSGTSQNNLVSPINMDNTDRYTVLYDKHWNFAPGFTQTKIIKMYKKLDFHISFNGTAIGTYEKNSIFLILVSNHSTASGTGPLVHWHSRLAYYDN